jgi:Transglutaminase-like superfamily
MTSPISIHAQDGEPGRMHNLLRALSKRMRQLDPAHFAQALMLSLTLTTASQAQTLGESPEVVYNGADALPLKRKAEQLGTAVAIYEYLHNTIEFSPYHGSRSGSVNTFLGQRGSDVDIATTLIAMLRSQGIPARYAIGTVRMPAMQLTNWLGVTNLDVAVRVLKDQGIQGVNMAADRSVVDFEHVWTEAFVPFDQYRGINTVNPPVDCGNSANFSRCTWVPLDASFKQKTYNGLNIDPYNALSFDYTAYYNAIKNNDPLRRDKNPLAILEEQIATWLRTAYPGKTLEDVEDAGTINQLREGLLPASLPLQVLGTTRRYDSVAAHDASVPSAEPKKWGKTIRVGVKFVANGVTISAGGTPTLLAEVSVKRLTATTEFVGPSNTPNLVVRLGGTEISRPISGGITIPGFAPYIGLPFTLTVTMDGSPGSVGNEIDSFISAEYIASIGGYYVIATGGENSNWTQVHRAADQLLTANSQIKIVFKPGQAGCQSDGLNCDPYVDANGNGVWDASDPLLLQDKTSMDALTGGVLYAGATQYFAKLREQYERTDRLMKIKTPIIGFLGVVSSTYEAEYIDSTAFSILPGGLLIDMKGITIGGSYRTNEASLNFSNRQFEFLGHIVSSLEHETWQELTGYDAVSTVRGFQMALAGGATLLNIKRDAGTNTIANFISATGFGVAAPTPFALVQRNIYNTRPTTWSHPTVTSGESFDAIKRTVVSSTEPRLGTLTYYNDFWDTNIKCFDDAENELNTFRATYGGSVQLAANSRCGTSWAANTTVDGAIAIMNTAYNNYRNASAGFFNYLDALQGFVSTDFAYRSKAITANAYSTSFVTLIRNDLSLRDVNQSWVEYSLPSTLITGCQYRFEVDIRKAYTTADGRLNSLSFEIANRGTTPSACQ